MTSSSETKHADLLSKHGFEPVEVDGATHFFLRTSSFVPECASTHSRNVRAGYSFATAFGIDQTIVCDELGNYWMADGHIKLPDDEFVKGSFFLDTEEDIGP